MEKILKKYTTIPDHLYVKRRADKQLKSIIDEMERPGYVLVARQMGKTNMLLHAIRAYSDDVHLFTYVDLSTSFHDEKGCFRNIIDNIIEPNENIFSSLAEKIHRDRATSNLPPHTEYIKELRQILGVFGGKIIIILDEIDALRSVTYSDHIFAQIRSSYFARTNYPEFKRLTYVLSGVVEPTELIKDKNKSPFNIGEKIYLDDFSKSEHDSFIQMAKLRFDEEISNHIYSWTNGNPRLTFDICADVEVFLSEQREISKTDIDSLIKSKYFTLYDLPPVDHIRDIVSKNKQIRQAVRSIQKKMPIESIELKRKLYLYGIINSDMDADAVEIKNRIISESLSLAWLDSIDRQGVELLGLGLEKVDELEYKEAIELLEEYLDNIEVTPKNREIAKYNLGYAYYKQDELDRAYELFDHAYELESYIYEAQLFKANILVTKKQHGEAEIIFKKIIAENTSGYAYLNALLNLGNSYYKQKKHDEALESFQKLKLSLQDDQKPDNRTLKLLANLGIIQILIEKKDVTSALTQIDEVLPFATATERLELVFTKYLISADKDKNLLCVIARDIIDNKLQFDTGELIDTSFTEYNNFRYLLELFVVGEFELFEELLHYTSNVLMAGKMTTAEILLHLANHTTNKQASLDVLKRVLEGQEERSDSLNFRINRSLLLAEDSTNAIYTQYITKYIELFDQSADPLEHGDISAFATILRYYSDKELFDTALTVIKRIEPRLSEVSDKLMYESLIIYYWAAYIYFNKRDNKTAVVYADLTLGIIDRYSRSSDSVLDLNSVKTIAEHMQQIKSSTIQQVPIIRTTKKYGRNERVKVRYQDGTIKEGKYKTFETDILMSKCFILN